MKVVQNLTELRNARQDLPDPFGVVPTMGFLHEGHLSLVRMARSECSSVGVSIFVNPTQFGPSEDLDSYPTDLDRDLKLLENERADLVWTPVREEVYGPGFQTSVEVTELTQHLEGRHRPGHFKGVTTVVTKLFNSFQPNKAYFGQKDAQQVRVIQRLVQDLDFPLQVVIGPTVREADGLAMSSRNSYFDVAERRAATVLYRALSAASEVFGTGEREAEALREAMSSVVAAEPLARPDYLSVAHPETLEELSGTVDRALLSLAVVIGKTRLIDNMQLAD